MTTEVLYFLVTHYYAEGPAIFLTRYLRSRGHSFIAIEHPFVFASRRSSTYTVFGHNGEETKYVGRRFFPITPLYWLRDVLGTVFFGLRHRAKLGIGFDNLNTLCLLFLRSLGKIEKVVYVTVDYTPTRFKNGLLNRMYHLVDRICCYYADVLWDSANAMRPARISQGIKSEKIRPTLVVDDGNDFEEEKIRPFQELKKYQLVYMGHVRAYQGISLLLDVTETLHRWDSRVELLLMGGGDQLDFISQQIKKRDMDSFITCTGFMKSHEELQERLRTSYLAFALYEDDPASFSKYSAVGKPKVYMGCGLPVIITDVPEIAKSIGTSRAGVVVPHDHRIIVEEVKKLILDPLLYQEMRANAIGFAKRTTWEAIFTEALQKTHQLLGL